MSLASFNDVEITFSDFSFVASSVDSGSCSSMVVLSKVYLFAVLETASNIEILTSCQETARLTLYIPGGQSNTEQSLILLGKEKLSEIF